MVDKAVATIGTLWKPITTIVALLVMGAVGLAKIEMNTKEIARVNIEGCKKSHEVLQRLPILETESAQYRRDIIEVKQELKDIKAILMGRP